MQRPLRPLQPKEFYETLGDGTVTIMREVTPFAAKRRGKGEFKEFQAAAATLTPALPFRPPQCVSFATVPTLSAIPLSTVPPTIADVAAASHVHGPRGGPCGYVSGGGPPRFPASRAAATSWADPAAPPPDSLLRSAHRAGPPLWRPQARPRRRREGAGLTSCRLDGAPSGSRHIVGAT